MSYLHLNFCIHEYENRAFSLSRKTGYWVTSDGSGCSHHMSVPSTASGGFGLKTSETERRLWHPLITTETIEFA